MDPVRPLFETDPAGGGADSGAAGDPVGAADPSAGDPGADPGADPGPAAEPWQGPSQQEWEQTQQVLQGLAPLVELAQSAGDPAAPGAEAYAPQDPAAENGGMPPLPDPFSPNYPQEMASFLEARDQALMERFAPVTERVFMGEAEQRLEQSIGALPPELGTVGLGEEHADRAREAITHMAAAFFRPDVPLPQVMQQSAEYVRDLIELGKTQGREEYLASLREGEGERQPTEPGVGAAGVPGNEPPKSYEEIIARGVGGAVGLR